MNLNEIVEELLSIEKVEPPKPITFPERIHNFVRRKEIEKELNDQLIADRESIKKAGKDANDFLRSRWYQEFIDPYIRNSVKTSLQTIIRDGENMTEVALKCEVVSIRKVLGLLATLKLRIARAEGIKDAV